jgi:hypothetical protein
MVSKKCLFWKTCIYYKFLKNNCMKEISVLENLHLLQISEVHFLPSEKPSHIIPTLTLYYACTCELTHGTLNFHYKYAVHNTSICNN